jgi:hypothetical protein
VIDQAGIYYRVPIACINNPQNYNKNNQLDELKQKKSVKSYSIKVSSVELIVRVGQSALEQRRLGLRNSELGFHRRRQIIVLRRVCN